MIGYIGEEILATETAVLYEDSGAMLIAIIILMREKGHGSGATGRGLSLLYRRKDDVYFNTAICQHSGNCVRGNASYLISNESRGSCRMKSTLPCG